MLNNLKMKHFPKSYLLLLLLIVACSKTENSPVFSTDTTSLVENINALSFDQDTENLISDASALNDSSSKRALSTDNSSYDKFKSRYARCATVNHDEENNRKTIFFGSDCNGRCSQSRTGTIVITYSEEKDTLGSFRQTEFDGFSMNGVQIEGTRRSEITAIDTNGNRTRHSSLQNGKMTYEDGTFSTKEKSFYHFTFYENDERKYATLTGSSSGVSSDGESFSMTIVSPIKYAYTCSSSNHFSKKWRVPVAGIKTIVNSSGTKTIDFGDGSCDFTAVVTTNGVSETIDLKKSKRGGKFKNF